MFRRIPNVYLAFVATMPDIQCRGLSEMKTRARHAPHQYGRPLYDAMGFRPGGRIAVRHTSLATPLPNALK